jgi:hypothetical protein
VTGRGLPPRGARPGGGFLAGAMQTALGVADALSNAFASGEQAVTGLAEEASATAEEAVSPFQDAAAEPPPEEHDHGRLRRSRRGNLSLRGFPVDRHVPVPHRGWKAICRIATKEAWSLLWRSSLSIPLSAWSCDVIAST